MNKMLKNSLILGLAAYFSCLTILSGCAKSGGDQFIGSWGVASSTESPLIIEKNGELYFILNESRLSMFCPSGATYDHGKLNCGNIISFGYDSKNDKLLIGDGALPRMK